MWKTLKPRGVQFLCRRNKPGELGKESLRLSSSILLPLFFFFFSFLFQNNVVWEEASEKSHLQSEAYVGSLEGKVRQTMT